MSKKTVCDRCGKELAEKPEWSPVAFPFITTYITIRLHSMGYAKGFDLCDDCKVDLVEWIRKGKEDQQ